MNKKKVLIIDDEAQILDIIRKKIEAEDFTCFLASSAEEGIRISKEKLPDLILLDIVMPDKNGYEVCQILKSNPQTKDIKILLTTGKDLTPEGLVQRCLDLGADDYILKPINLKNLIDKIEEILK